MFLHKIRLASSQDALICFSSENGGRSSMVEPWIVVPAVAGSSPVGHPVLVLRHRDNHSLIAIETRHLAKACCEMVKFFSPWSR